MENFDKLKQAGLADESFTNDERDEINDLSPSLVDKIIAAAKEPEGLDGAAGMQ